MSSTSGVPKFRIGLMYGDANDPGRQVESTESVLLAEFDELDDVAKSKHVYAVAGLALYKTQLIEADLHIAILLHGRLTGNYATAEEWEKFDGKLSEKTIGALLVEVKKIVSIDDDALKLLGEALRVRNGLCHGFFERNSFEMMTNAGQRRVCGELASIITKIEFAQIVTGVLTKSLISALGIDEEELHAEAQREVAAARERDGE